MPQIQLPIFPAGATEINQNIAVVNKDNIITYINGHLPIFAHPVEDLATFRMFTSQLIHCGSANIGDIVRTFGVSPTTVKRALRLFREGGLPAFYVKKSPRRGHCLTPEKLLEATDALNDGQRVPEVAILTGVLTDTLRKAIKDGRLPAANLKKKS